MHGGVSATGGKRLKREGEEWSSGCVVEDVVVQRSAWSDEEEGSLSPVPVVVVVAKMVVHRCGAGDDGASSSMCR